MELAYKFVKSKDLVNRIYNMVVYFEIIKDLNHEDIIKIFFHNSLCDIAYIESLAKYFETKRLKYKSNIEVLCNLNELIDDLNSLKQYLK